MQRAEEDRSVTRARARALMSGIALLALTTFSALAVDNSAPSGAGTSPTISQTFDIPDQPGPGPTDREAETAEMEGEVSEPTHSSDYGLSPRAGLTLQTKPLVSMASNEELTGEGTTEETADDRPTREPATTKQAVSPRPQAHGEVTNSFQVRPLRAEPIQTVRATPPVPPTVFESSPAESATQLDVVAQGVMSAAAVLLVLVAASVYTGTLRKRLSQQNEFIHKRGEALAAVEARLRDSFAATRADLEARIEEQQAELAQLQRALESETQARVRAENALSEITLHDDSIAGSAENTPCPCSQARGEEPESCAEPSLEPAGDNNGCSTISPGLTDWPGTLRYDLGSLKPLADPKKLPRKRSAGRTTAAKKTGANRSRKTS